MKFMSKNKKFFSTALTATAIAAAVVVPSASADSEFTDVNDRYSDAVTFLWANDIAQGTSATQFGTMNEVKRSDAAVFIAKVMGFDEKLKYTESGFTDVPDRAKWAVDALYENNIIKGKSNTRFGSNDSLTRNEAAAILVNAAKLKMDVELTKTQFTDVNSRFAPFVDALVKANISLGKEATKFGAEDSIKRGELAILMDRANEHFGFFNLMVMHMNDHHAYLEPFPYIATIAKEIREQHKNNLLLHAGDAFSGDLYFNAFKGQADVALMNYLKVDAMTFGNHEFDLGNSEDGHLALKEFINKADFPLLSANVDFSKDELFKGMQTRDFVTDYENAHIYDGVVLDVNGEKIGVFGLTTEETTTISSTGAIVFENYIDRAKAAVKSFEDSGIDKIIAVTHIGLDDSLVWDNDRELASKVAGIDIIVGGHTHTKIENAEVVNKHGAPTIIVQANEYGKVLGTLNAKFNKKGEIYAFAGELLSTDPKEVNPDPNAVSILKPYKEKVAELKEESIGVEAVVDLDGKRDANNEGTSSVRHNETNLGNMIADAMLNKAREINDKVTIAVQNGGGIRTSIAAGDITTGDVLTVMPFGNPLAIVEMSGADIRKSLEHSVGADAIDDGKGLKESGGFLHIAGMKFTYDSTLSKGSRVLTVQVQEDDVYVNLDDQKTYFIATNTFTAKGGDGFSEFGNAYEAGKVSEPGFSDYENFIEYAQKFDGKIEPKIEGRIIDISLDTQQNGFVLAK